MSKIISFELNASYIGESKKIWVYLPNNYDNADKLPVIYMNDGQELFYDQADKTSWHVAETMDELYDTNNLSAIVVGVEASSTRRDEEYSPWAFTRANAKLFGDLIPDNGFFPMGDSYADFVTKQVKIYIDQNFKTNIEPEYNAIIGSSMGAQMAVLIGMKYHYLYGCIGSFSAFTYFNYKKFNRFVQQIDTTKMPNMYIYYGGKEARNKKILAHYTDCAKLLYSEAVARNANAKIVTDSQGTHNVFWWKNEFGNFVKYFFDNMPKKD